MVLVMLCHVASVGSATAASWSTGWPAGVVVYSLTADASGNVYAGTNQGIYKSSNAGLQWSTTNNGAPIASATQLVVTPTNTVYAANGGAVFASTNSGSSWTDVALDANSYNLASIYSLLSDREGNIFAGYRHRVGTASFGASIAKLAANSSTWRSAFYFGGGFFTFYTPNAFALDSNNHMYSGVRHTDSNDPYNPKEKGLIYKSTDGGATWSLVNVTALPPVLSLVSGKNGLLYVGTSVGAVYLSRDGGLNWAATGSGLPSTSINTLAADSNGWIYAGTEGAGVFTSSNEGVSWSAMNSGLSSTAKVKALAVDSSNRIYAATDGGVFQFSNAATAYELRVNLVGASSATIDSSTGHGGQGNYALTVTPGSVVKLSAPLSSGSQVFSHWVGCDSSAPTATNPYFNGCDLLMPASGHKRVTAVYTSPNSKLINISTRAKILTGDHVLIAGFVISGGPKKVLIKAAGPSMAALNPPVPNTLSNPMLTLFSGSTPLASNDDWESANNAATISASGIAPAHPQEAALLVTLQPGAYTVIVQGVAGGTGIGLVSVDDLDAFDSSSRLINISSRAYASTGGDDQVIAGFVLQGDPKELFIAGAGPSMTKYGVPGTLTNPFSTLYSQQTILNSNDNWNESADTTRIDTRTVGTMDTPESAIVHTLSQGAYTIIMRGTGTSGIGLISVEE
jgi:hypothetical protein